MVGVRGSSSRAPIVDAARGSVDCREGSRQGVVPARLLGETVRAMAYERRR